MDLGLTFLLETDVFGTTEIIELKQKGKDTLVTDSNKVMNKIANKIIISFV